MPQRKTVHIFLLALLAVFIFSYLNQLFYQYQVPPGGDAVHHNEIILAILRGDWSLIYRYHTVWHLCVIAIAWLLHARTITVMAWLGPILLVGTATTLYYFNARHVGFVAGITSLLLIGLFSFQPAQTLYDGGFPNVLAAGIVLPLFLMSFNQIFISHRKILAIGSSLLLLVLLIFSHHITTLYGITVVFFTLLFFIIHGLRNRHISWGVILPAIVFIIAILPLGLRWLLSLHLGSALDLAAQFIKLTPHYPFISLSSHLDNPNAYWPLSAFPNAIGEAVVYLGAAGFIVSLFRIITKHKRDECWEIYLILVIWAVVLTIGSQMFALGFPVRLARDLAIPLALLGGVFVQSVYGYIAAKKLPWWLFSLFACVCLVLGTSVFWERLQRGIFHNPLVSHLPVDSKAARYITEHLPLDARIVAFQDDIYLPLFTPLHHISWVENPRAQNIIEQNHLDTTLQSIDYLYIELRFDRDGSESNSSAVPKSYLKSPYTTLEAVFEQPEKKVFLFKVNHTPPL